MIDRVLSVLGMATRAGKSASGGYQTETAVKKGKAWLVIVACDASDNAKKNYKDMCAYYDVPLIVYGDKESLGKATGHEMRVSAAILDEGLAQSALKRFEEVNAVREEIKCQK